MTDRVAILAPVARWFRRYGNPRNRVGHRLVLATTAFGVVVTCMVAGVQMFAGYRQDVAAVQANVAVIRSSHLTSITSNIWLYEAAVVQQQLDGLAALPGIAYLELRTAEGRTFVAGDLSAEPDLVEEMPLVYVGNGAAEKIGVLKIAASYALAYQRLSGTAFSILVYAGLWTVLVTGFMILLFHRLVTRHLHSLAEYARGVSIDRHSQPLH